VATLGFKFCKCERLGGLSISSLHSESRLITYPGPVFAKRRPTTPNNPRFPYKVVDFVLGKTVQDRRSHMMQYGMQTCVDCERAVGNMMRGGTVVSVRTGSSLKVEEDGASASIACSSSSPPGIMPFLAGTAPEIIPENLPTILCHQRTTSEHPEALSCHHRWSFALVKIRWMSRESQQLKTIAYSYRFTS
jgi:hypothetical protein